MILSRNKRYCSSSVALYDLSMQLEVTSATQECINNPNNAFVVDHTQSLYTVVIYLQYIHGIYVTQTSK